MGKSTIIKWAIFDSYVKLPEGLIMSNHYIQWIGLRENLRVNHRLSYKIWGFPVKIPLNQTIELSTSHVWTNCLPLWIPEICLAWYVETFGSGMENDPASRQDQLSNTAVGWCFYVAFIDLEKPPAWSVITKNNQRSTIWNPTFN